MTQAKNGQARQEFLMKMYEQMFNNINRHIMITWEVVPVVGGALGAVALSATENVSVQVAGTIVVLLAAWLCAHALDSNEWVKRNLFIISNIERQFLESDDARSIHYFFPLRHEAEILRHFQIQLVTAGVIAAASAGWVGYEACRTSSFPSLFVVSSALVLMGLLFLHRKTRKRLTDFIEKSPGEE